MAIKNKALVVLSLIVLLGSSLGLINTAGAEGIPSVAVKDQGITFTDVPNGKETSEPSAAPLNPDIHLDNNGVAESIPDDLAEMPQLEEPKPESEPEAEPEAEPKSE